MRGIQFITAIGLISELGDLTRFEHPRQLMAWFGITPSEYSSGGSRHQGSITKTGNSYARKLLVEAAWSYRHPARISPAIQNRQENLPKPIIDRRRRSPVQEQPTSTLCDSGAVLIRDVRKWQAHMTDLCNAVSNPRISA